MLRIAYNVLCKELIADVRSDDEGETEVDEDERGDMSGSELSRQVSAVDAKAELEKLYAEDAKADEPLFSRNMNGGANGNGHAVLGNGNGNKALVGLGIDARKGSLKEGSDEDDEFAHRGNGKVVERKKNI